MHIAFPCSGCGRKVRAPAAAAGKKGKCPHCGGVQTIPSLQEQTSPAPTAIPNDPPKVDRPPNNTMALADTGTSVPPGDPGTTVLPDDSAHHAGLTPPEAVKVATSPAEGRLEHLTAELKKAEAEFDQAEAESRQAEAEVKMVKQASHLKEVELRASRASGYNSALSKVAASLLKDQSEVDQAKAELKKAEAEVKMAERARHLTEVARLVKSATDEANSTPGAGRKAVVAEKEAGNALAEDTKAAQDTTMPSAADPSCSEEQSKSQSGWQEGLIPGLRAFTIHGRIFRYRAEDGWEFDSLEEAIAHQPRLRAEARRAAAKNGPKRQGECSRCGKANRSLRETEDNNWVCPKCRRELYPALATKGKIQYLRSVGFTVPDDLTEKECKRLWFLHYGRKLGLSLPDDTPLEELLRMEAEDSLTQRAQSVLAAEHERHVTEDIERRSEYLPPVRHFYTKVAGVSYKNDDGSDRQEILSTCSPLQTLLLEHEDNNPHDANAIRVCTADGRQIGHLFRDVASDVWWRMQHHFTYSAISANIYGGTKDCPSLGMNILLLVGRPGVSEEEMRAYLDNIMPAVTADAYDDRSDGNANDDDDEPEQEFTLRGGTMVPVDEVVRAWTSGDIRRMLKAMDLKTNPIDRHFLLLNIVTQTYKQRAVPAVADTCLRVAQTHLAQFPQLLPFLRKEFPDRLPQVPTFQHYATVLAERDRFSEAIQVCEAAIRFGIQDGTKGGYEGRIVRIKNQQERTMAEREAAKAKKAEQTDKDDEADS